MTGDAGQHAWRHAQVRGATQDINPRYVLLRGSNHWGHGYACELRGAAELVEVRVDRRVEVVEFDAD